MLSQQIQRPPTRPVDPELAKIAWNRPIPGQSLAAHAPRSVPWQQPPQFVKIEDAMHWLMDTITEPIHLKQILDLMEAGMSIEVITRTFLFTGFAEGKWTASLMILMYKPLMLAFIAIAKRAKMHDTPVIHPTAFNRYHLNKLKQSAALQRAKDSETLKAGTMDGNPVPTEANLNPAPANTGFMNRRV